MRNLKIKRLDHHGIVAGVIDDLKIVEIVNQWVGVDEPEPVSAGMIIKSMILNGLGFSSRPLTLSPQLFQNIAMEHLFGPGITPDLFNRHQIGRVLDTIFESDGSALFSQLSKEAGRTENVETRVQSLDTTSFSTFGEYPESDDELPAEAQPISITYGHSKDRRPDLSPAVVELIVSQDGRVATFMKWHDRNASDSVICRKRTKALVDEMKKSGGLGILVADSKLYSKENIEWLAQTEFITRIPSTNKLEKELTMKAVATSEMWCSLPNNYRYQSQIVEHNGMQQRWIVFDSEAARGRVEQTINRKAKKEMETVQKRIRHLQARDFSCENEAQGALAQELKKLKLLRVGNQGVSPIKRYATKGKPGPKTPVKRVDWKCKVEIEIDQDLVENAISMGACFVLGTNVDPNDFGAKEVLDTYKAQSSVEQGFRFIKGKTFFADSLFLKKPARIEALLTVMCLSLLVYSIAQLRLRRSLKAAGETIPNQIRKQISNPTMRWVFQLFEGINLLEMTVGGTSVRQIDGMDELRNKVVKHLGKGVLRLYSDFSGEGCSM